MNPVNPIYIIMAVIVAMSGMVCGLINNVIDQPDEESIFEKYIKDNVTQVDNEIQALKSDKNTSGLGQFRTNCQDTQQYITGKFQAASRDSGISKEERRLNGEYKAFLIEASNLIDQFLSKEKEDPDYIRYDYLRDEILDNRILK